MEIHEPKLHDIFVDEKDGGKLWRVIRIWSKPTST